MAYGEYTLGEFRKLTKDMPDNTILVVKPDNEDFQSCEPSRQRDRTTNEIVRHPGKPAKVWNYNTRFVQNAYSANDDRLAPRNGVVTIEIGEPLP